MPSPYTVALIGARGYVGRELIRLIEAHPALELVHAASRGLAGRPVAELTPTHQGGLRFVTTDPEAPIDADVVFLALPNGLSEAYVARCRPEALLIDLSTDHRFAPGWVYGFTERDHPALRGARRISNPGCYATAMQCALWPILDHLASRPVCFGVSGYSGAGTRPTPKNDPKRLADNLLPYHPAGHFHEGEVSHHLGQPVRFLPHVAAFFRGIHLTATARLKAPMTLEQVQEIYKSAYAQAPFVRVIDELPEVKNIAHQNHAEVGLHVSSDGLELTAMSTVDNLLKGAASQAIQNLNAALGFDQAEGLR
ncbi:N-acetyl-gamma-glutamyl-phosphate reductase [Myxococcota bacterium]|nr:N-acetyl-gamma-glutamyl-phosphate reductase [Myxococcota bacterium]MBU1431834.1 N-acetyl-gamma-glutamyl-phosphate reductase [Myxococcota bacterium]MBU1897950.1 N-acetyl-gamma-glutamyl-phosphate reductase [Myxococcota bacterium]